MFIRIGPSPIDKKAWICISNCLIQLVLLTSFYLSCLSIYLLCQAILKRFSLSLPHCYSCQDEHECLLKTWFYFYQPPSKAISVGVQLRTNFRGRCLITTCLQFVIFSNNVHLRSGRIGNRHLLTARDSEYPYCGQYVDANIPSTA